MSKPQLFMFHFAGGNENSFNFLEPGLQEFKIETIELPGRGMRSGEMLIKNFSVAADDCYRQVREKLNTTNFVLYGHSMGASLAFRVAKMLEQENISPSCLIVTGNAGPKVKGNVKRYLLKPEDFIKEVKILGGLSPEFLESQELMDYFMPIMKADFEIAEENNLDSKSIINTPVYAVMGDSEKHVKDIANWSGYTTSDFKYEVLQGDHFFIRNHAERLSTIILKFYRENALKTFL